MTVLGLQVTLRAGEMPEHVPAHVDAVLGAAEPAAHLDGGSIDRVLARFGAFQATNVYPARRSFGDVGSQNRHYDDCEHAHGLSRTVRVRLADASHVSRAIAALRDLAIVDHVRADVLATTLALHEPEPACASVHGRDLVRATSALTHERGDERVIVAVVDSGVSLGHPELRRKLLAGYDTVDLGYGRVGDLQLIGHSRGVDFNPRDEVGHGSHVAGIIGAQGYQMPRGIAGLSLIVPIRVLAAALAPGGKRPIGVGATSDIDCGLKVACDLGAKVINMSFGTGERSLDPDAPPPHGKVLRYASSLGIVLVAAMGNTSDEERLWPAAHPEVLAVGAVDANFRPTSFSTRGAHVALSAPGEQIYSLDLHGYRCSSGTSHSAPFVSGAAALLVSAGRRVGVELGGADVRRLLLANLQARPEGGWNDAMGHGVLDVAAALTAFRKERRTGTQANGMSSEVYA